jgi:hypothetical protein
MQKEDWKRVSLRAVGFNPSVICLLFVLAVVAGGPDSDVWSCVVRTTKMEITIAQIWGWKQAQVDPEVESWAMPFTW